MTNFATALEFRKNIQKEFEELRKAGRIGKTFELGLILNVPSEIPNFLFNQIRLLDSSAYDFLREVLKISQLVVNYSENKEFNYKIVVLKEAGYVECPRCQTYHMGKLNAQVERDGVFSCLCNSCISIIVKVTREEFALEKIMENLNQRGLTVEDID